MENSKNLLEKTKLGFSELNVNSEYINKALSFLEEWLTKDEFKDYLPQIDYLIANKQWDYLLNSFYQIIPFGTGGRRGEVGIGPNRINPWTIRASAQGHSQYLLKKYGEDAKKRGVVFAYDIREFSGNKFLSDNLPNPLKNLSSKDLAITATKIYTANGIIVHLFNEFRTTPELSFAIRYLHAISGVMFSASHNPPDHNGKKIYDEHGGQLIPPEDEALVNEVTNNVKEVKEISYDSAFKEGLIKEIGTDVDYEYIKIAGSISLSKERNIKIIYTPLHGCGLTSVYKTLINLGFEVTKDPKTSNPSGKFENVTFNIPNPEVVQSFDTTLKFAEGTDTDIILSSDPDADRIGIMVKHNNEWVFLNGNEIASILTDYVIGKRTKTLNTKGIIIKTTVTTNLIKKICEKNDIELVGELLIGFKYIADVMNKLDTSGVIDNFLLGCEESHGFVAGNYVRDKDAVTAAVWLAELAAELKKNNKTLIDYLNLVYIKYGYFRNYLTEIRIQGASGKEKINTIQSTLRNNCPTSFGKFKVLKFEDCLQRQPIVSKTDRSAKDLLIFYLENEMETEIIKVTVRPSGTESKIKMYFEIGTNPTTAALLEETKSKIENLLHELEKEVMLTCYKMIGIDFPIRGFLLFWQLPLDDKMKYFEIEPTIEKLKEIKDKDARKNALFELLTFLGSNPIEKVDAAFKEKNDLSMLDYLSL